MMSCRTCKNWIGPNVTYVDGHDLCFRKCRLMGSQKVKENELCNSWELSLSHEQVSVRDKKWIALCNQAREDENEQGQEEYQSMKGECNEPSTVTKDH